MEVIHHPLFWMDTDSPRNIFWIYIYIYISLNIIFTAMSREMCLPGLAVGSLKNHNSAGAGDGLKLYCRLDANLERLEKS